MKNHQIFGGREVRKIITMNDLAVFGICLMAATSQPDDVGIRKHTARLCADISLSDNGIVHTA